MRAWAEANHAVTVVNAIPTGVGAALAVSLRLRVAAEPSDELAVEYAGVDPGDSRLVEEAARLVRGITGWDGWWRLLIESRAPPRRGLKTSSAAANALVAAMMLAVGREPSRNDVLALGVEAAKRAGVTVTGALDDAGASLLGGLVVADNTRGRLLERKEVEAGDVVVLVSVPDYEIPKTSVDKRALRALAPVSKRALRLLLEEGRIWDAMTLNGILVAAALRIDDSVVVDALEAGALAAGVTGTGPAIAAVAPREYADRVAAALDSYGKVMRLDVENRPGSWACRDS